MNFCPKCGFPTENMKFCPKCGFELKTLEPAELDDVDTKLAPVEKVERVQVARSDSSMRRDREDEIKKLRSALIGEKVDHYIPIFEDLDRTGGSSWNWCGCLFSPYWFAYRKMYGWSAIAIAIPLVLGFIIGLMLISYSGDTDTIINGASRLIGIACAIFFGVVSNKAYKKRIDKLVEEAPKDADALNKYIKSKGGVSAGGMILALIVGIGLNFGLALI